MDINRKKEIRHPRVLVIAETANPDWVSVPLVGWSQWHAISRVVDAHLVTHIKNKENILAFGEDRQRVSFIDPSLIERPINWFSGLLRGGASKGLTTATAFGVVPYYYFEFALWQMLGKKIKAGEWDIVHRITPLSPVTPSYIAHKCHQHGVPFVLGPLNGGLPWPKGFSAARNTENEWLTYVREAYRLLPGYRSTRQYASAIITASRDTREQISKRYQEKTVYIPENGINPDKFPEPPVKESGKPLRVTFVGRLTLYKGADMLIEAAAPLVHEGKIELKIIGDGPQNDALRSQASELSLPENIFTGWIQYDEVQAYLANTDLLGFPSIREFGGGVVLEAMARGIVPVVVDYGGPGELVTAKTGYAVPMGRRGSIVSAFRQTLSNICDNPSGLSEMGRLARQRVLKLFTWDAKAAQICEVYRWVLGERAKPDFGMPFPDLME